MSLLRVLLLFFTLTLLACNQQSINSKALNEHSSEVENKNQLVASEQHNKVVRTIDALPEDVTRHKVDCQGKNKKDKKICIVVCHRPPGNPSNSKSIVLPLQAVFAHLKHGCKNKHTEHDTMGYCELQDDDSGEDSGSNPDNSNDEADNDEGSNSSDSGSNSGDESDSDDGSNPDQGGGDDDNGSEIPAWCEMNYDIDSDCDGYNDATGEGLY